jgi:alpha/beta hydrolase fold
VLCGDSAGGGLAVATLLATKKAALPLPAGFACFSPWTDLSLSGQSYVTNADHDPQVSRAMLAEMAAHYVGQHDVATDLISPVHGDLAGLPPLLIQVGDAEALLDDSRALSDAATAAGVDVTLEIWPAMTHVWQLYTPRLPEARDAVDQTAAWLDSVWRRARLRGIPQEKKDVALPRGRGHDRHRQPDPGMTDSGRRTTPHAEHADPGGRRRERPVTAPCQVQCQHLEDWQRLLGTSQLSPGVRDSLARLKVGTTWRELFALR